MTDTNVLNSYVGAVDSAIRSMEFEMIFEDRGKEGLPRLKDLQDEGANSSIIPTEISESFGELFSDIYHVSKVEHDWTLYSRIMKIDLRNNPNAKIKKKLWVIYGFDDSTIDKHTGEEIANLAIKESEDNGKVGRVIGIYPADRWKEGVNLIFYSPKLNDRSVLSKY